jgi:ferredoxin
VANKQSKWHENVPGEFYVDDQCIACEACIVEAPRFFSMNKSEGHAYVILQPRLEKDIQECLDALNLCPVEAIGRDGDGDE